MRDGCCVYVNSRDADFSWLEVYGFTVGASRPRISSTGERGQVRATSQVHDTCYLRHRFELRQGSAYDFRHLIRVSSRACSTTQDTRRRKTRASRETEEKRSWNVTVQSFVTYIGILYFEMTAVFTIGLSSASIITISVLVPIDSTIFQSARILFADIKSRYWPRVALSPTRIERICDSESMTRIENHGFSYRPFFCQ